MDGDPDVFGAAPPDKRQEMRRFAIVCCVEQPRSGFFYDSLHSPHVKAGDGEVFEHRLCVG